MNTLSDSKKAAPKLVMLGAGGHARVLQEVLSEVGFELHGFVAPRDTESQLGAKADGEEVEWLGADDNLLDDVGFLAQLIVGEVGQGNLVPDKLVESAREAREPHEVG